MTGEGAAGAPLGGVDRRLVHRFPDRFADAEAPFEAARFVVLGLPYEPPSPPGPARPSAPRRSARRRGISTFNVRNGMDLRDPPIHDVGDLDLAGLSRERMFDRVPGAAHRT